MTDAPQSEHSSPAPRRPLATRQLAWAKALAGALTRWNVSPNSISIAGLVFAIGAGLFLLLTAHAGDALRAILFLAAAFFIQLRLLCNLLDGMVAIEGGRRTSYGELLNDMPDRFADLVILVAAGYSLSDFAWGRELGWIAGTLAVLTAYVRILGGSMGLSQNFTGPMAKQHRMAIMTVACVLSTFEPVVAWHGQVMLAALAIVSIGSIGTIVRRTARIVADLRAR